MSSQSEPLWDKPNAMVDVVAITLVERELKVILLKRNTAPFEGEFTLIGGYVHVEEDKTLDDAVTRILRDKAGISGAYTEQLYSFGSAFRDARGWSITVSYLAIVPYDLIKRLPADVIEVRSIDAVGNLPFDHNEILNKAIERVHGKSAYSVLPAMFLPPKFTALQLKDTYEAVLGLPKDYYDQSSFRRKMAELQIVEIIDNEWTGTGRGKSQLYRVRPGASTFRRTI